MPDAEPVHAVAVDGFWIDTTPVTNAQFDAFVKATRYVTVAERKPDAKDYPGVPADKLVAGSACFKPPCEPVPLDDETRAAIREGREQARRGEFVSDEDMAAFFKRHGVRRG